MLLKLPEVSYIYTRNNGEQGATRQAFVAYIGDLVGMLRHKAFVSPVFPIILPRFRLYEVVALHACVLPYKYRKILEMLLELTKFFKIMFFKIILGRSEDEDLVVESLGQCPAP